MIARSIVVARVLTTVMLACVIAGGSSRSLAGTVEDADAAFAAGDHDRALEMYEQVLADRPDDPHALFRTGQLLSWSRRFDEAIARYDRLLELDPDHPRAALERAKVLSWARRFDEAEQGFLDVLERDPASTEARLGLARTLSWSGKQRAARDVYHGILEADPDNADVMVGIAQTYAWTGDPARARPWYERALAIDPEHKSALLGLAYIDLWALERPDAAARLADLERRYPQDSEVAELALARERAVSWWGAVSWDWLDDTEDNRMNTYRVEAGYGPTDRWDLRFGLARYDLDSPIGDGTIDSLYGIAGWTPIRSQRVMFRLGADFAKDSTGDRDTREIGGVSWRYRPDTWWEIEVAANRDSLRYSPLINDNRIVIDSLRASATTRPAERWRAVGTIDTWHVSDGNARNGLLLEGWYAWDLGPIGLETGYTFQWSDWDENLDNGYFDPQDFTAHLLRAKASGTLPIAGGRWEAGASVGVQSFETGGISVNNDTVVGLSGRAIVPLTQSLTLDAYALWTDYAAGSATGFESRQIGIRLRWQP